MIGDWIWEDLQKKKYTPFLEYALEKIYMSYTIPYMGKETILQSNGIYL